MTSDSDRIPAAPDPVVSVIIPTYNSAGTVERALRSVRMQTGVSFEIIVVDDCSSDDTATVVRGLNWPNLRLIVRSTNGRAGAARNDGLRAAVGQFVAFLDADDEWLPGKLLRQVEVFRAQKRASLSTTDCDLVYPDGHHIRFHSKFPLVEGDSAWKVFLEGNSVVTSTVMCRRLDALRLGGFREELHYGEDLDLWIRLAEQGEVHIVREVLGRWYSQPSGLSATQPLGDLTFVLPMIAEHVDRLASRLSAEERRRVLGIRSFDIGYALYRVGQTRKAAPLFRRSFNLGWRRGVSAVYYLDCCTGGILRRVRLSRAN